jgi:lipopolysaccharide biosynthesis glycosyltransferase
MTNNSYKEQNIALAFDENYLTPIYALLTSIFSSNKKNQIAFHLIVTGINTQHLEDLKQFIVKNNACVFFYQVDIDELEKKIFLPDNSHYTAAAYYRLLFPQLIPESVSKLLYIDSDTVVINDLKELFDIEVGRYPLAAVVDPHPVIRTDLGIHEANKYFNSGVLLIDTANWKEQEITKKAFDFINHNHEKIVFVDQDVLNAILIDNWLPIDMKYNVMLLDVVLQTPKRELIKDKVIIHYTSPWKPWHCLTKNKLRSVYHHYLRLSPRRNEKKYTDFKWDAKTISTFLRIRMKELYFDKKIDKVFPIKKWKEIKYNNY